MTESEPFEGFPKKALLFFKELGRNNEREWFNEHKGDYQEYVLKPAQSFVSTLGRKLRTISEGLEYDTSTGGRGSIMRIYRDIRFSKDKRPYYDYLRTIFWEGIGKKTENPGFMFWMSSEEGGIYGGLHVFPKPLLATYREAVDHEIMGPALEKAVSKVSSKEGYTVGKEHFKKVPGGYDPDHKRAALLKYNGLYSIGPSIQKPVLTRPDLVDEVFEQCKKMTPIYKWLNKLIAGKAQW
ncbi:MAG: DUF2461 domain-containing protein [Candidatus Thorarchaeota archaeon]|nr:MAG: DUF2461 domain-containing protein [Candidatus Thorarchaeota archaeon]